MTIRTWAQKFLMHWKILLLLVGLGLTGSLAASGLNRLFADIEIQKVILEGDLKYLNKIELERELSVRFTGQFLDSALAQVISKVESYPWVADASVRRIWPDTLVVEVKEQRPVAIYNDTQYLGQSGDLFEPFDPADEPLPKLYGRLSEVSDVYGHFVVFTDYISDVGDVISVARGTDQGWVVVLDTGIRLQLGRSDILGRLSRARDVMFRLDPIQLDRVTEIDARYENGVAISWGGDA